MGAAEMLEDAFPHGTREGYEKGCRGSHCPAVEDGHLSCFQARTRYVSDFAYRRRVDAGMTLEELAAADEADAAEQRARIAAASSVMKKAVKPEPSIAVTAEPTPEPEPEPTPARAPIEAALSLAAASGIAYEKHGSTSGYSAGCRDKTSCPGLTRVGKSCTQAVSEYQRELKRKRRAEQKEVEPAVETPAAVEPAAEVTEDGVPVEDEALTAAVERAERAEAQLAAAVTRNAELLTRVAALEMELDVAKSAAADARAKSIATLSRGQLIPMPAPGESFAPGSRFRFQRDEQGGVAVDVEGPTPGFVRFELDDAGALVGVAVQSGRST